MLNSSNIYQYLENLCRSQNYVVAFSGGLDSHVLLHLLSLTKNKSINISAIYINHGLQLESNNWGNHCQKICEDLGVSYKELSLNLDIKKSESLEEVARRERYKALHSSLSKDDVLVTAHHQNDQAETLLLQLFRGAGVQGLASMPAIREFGPKNSLRLHARPLLNQTRYSLEQYALLHELDYIEDPSNADEAFDRNFLRNKIMPQLRQRWEGIDKTISRAATIQAETKQVLDEVAAKELPLLVADGDTTENTLIIPELLKHTQAKQHLLVRHWIAVSGFFNPSDKILKQLFKDVVHAGKDSQPLLEWQDTQIRRFQHKLYLLTPLLEHDITQIIPWDGKKSLDITSLGMTINPSDISPRTQKAMTIRFRQGGEKIDIPQRGSISLKNLLQESGIPPWMRSRLPLIFEDDNLVQVLGIKRHPPTF